MTFQKGDYQLMEGYYKAVSEPLPELKKTFELETGILMKYIDETDLLTRIRYNWTNYHSNMAVLDIGCGIGRPLIDLAKKFSNIPFTGIDNDICNLAVANIRVKDNTLKNVTLENCDALNLPEKYNNKFDLVYSTYNTIGSVEYGYLSRFIEEQSKATKKGGFIINFTWSRSKKTTEFLKEYYPHIGLDVVNINEEKTVLKGSHFYRLHGYFVSHIYAYHGIDNIATENAGVWKAFIGRKL